VLDRLVRALSELPGVGRRSAERMAWRLALDEQVRKETIAALAEIQDRLCVCGTCGNLTTVDRNPCGLCTNQSRDGRTLCVVEDPGDILLMERSGGFRGRYHVLMGKLTASRGAAMPPGRVDELVARVRREGVEEVVLAVSTDMDGDATAGYVAERLKGTGARVSRLAAGLPVMSGVSYADPVTLARAMAGRQKM
jgi:recombination protein RecR